MDRCEFGDGADGGGKHVAEAERGAKRADVRGNGLLCDALDVDHLERRRGLNEGAAIDQVLEEGLDGR